MSRLLLLLVCLSLPLCSVYPKPKMDRCSGTFSYYYSESISHAEAKAKAKEEAIARALAEKYGTTVTSQSMLVLTQGGDRYNQVTRLQVKGKWVKNLHEPKFSSPEFADNMFRIDVTVDFYARAIDYAPTEFVAKALRNGLEDKFASEEFVDGDKFYMSFETPKTGYAAVFFEDRDMVYCMLPYMDEEDAFHVEKGKRYVLFNKDNNTYHMTCGEEPEINYVHVLFSTKKFIDGDVVREMGSSKFRDWLGTRQSYDDGLQIQSVMIKVNPAKR